MIAKQILDKWATAVVPKDAIFMKDGEAQVNQNKCRHYEGEGYKEDLVLWIPPPNCIRIEFEDTETHNQRFILELEAAAKALGIDYCITGHKGKSDYFNMFNIKGIPVNEDNKYAKILLIESLLPRVAKDQLDKTNLGWTLSPIIEHSHWKLKYNGEVHKILRGKNPIEHNNEYPKKLLTLIKKSKEWIKKHSENTLKASGWIEDFLINFCCNNKLPGGERHFVIEKNLAALLLHRKDRDEVKERYYKTQERRTDTLRTWEAAILRGDYSNISAGEIAKYIKRHDLDFEIPEKKKERINFDYKHLEEAIDNITSYIDFLDLANQFYEIQPYFYDKQSIWWLWNINNKAWEIIDDIDLMNRIDDSIQRPDTITSKVKNEIIESLKRVGRRRIPKELPRTTIQFKDKLFDIKTGEITEATPKVFATNPIPHDIGETEETPTMDKLFEEWVGKDYVKTLYQIISYCCLIDYPIHLMFCLIGVGRNGKSRFLALLTKFIGKDNVCSTELDTLLDSRFESFKLYRKLACTMGETNFGLLSKTSLLKRLCGQDMIGYEFKNKQPFDDYNYAKIIISSNALPSSADTSEGFYRRWLIVDFPNTFPEGNDILQTIPDIEYNNLAKKVIRILPELLTKTLFNNQGTVKERQERYIAASNPLSIFINEHCCRGTELYMKYSELYLNYIKYLLKNKRRKISRKEFKNVLDDEGLDVSKTTKYEGDQAINGYFIDGIEMKDDITGSNKENKQPFDTRLIQHQKCNIENCHEFEVNPDSEGRVFCRKHWDVHAKTY